MLILGIFQFFVAADYFVIFQQRDKSFVVKIRFIRAGNGFSLRERFLFMETNISDIFILLYRDLLTRIHLSVDALLEILTTQSFLQVQSKQCVQIQKKITFSAGAKAALTLSFISI